MIRIGREAPVTVETSSHRTSTRGGVGRSSVRTASISLRSIEVAGHDLDASASSMAVGRLRQRPEILGSGHVVPHDQLEVVQDIDEEHGPVDGMISILQDGVAQIDGSSKCLSVYLPNVVPHPVTPPGIAPHPWIVRHTVEVTRAQLGRRQRSDECAIELRWALQTLWRRWRQ